MDAGRNNRAEHFFAYLPYQEKNDPVSVQDSVIGCHKIKVTNGDKSKSVVVFTRIPIAEFDSSKAAKKSAGKAIDQMKNFFQINGMKKSTASSTVHNIKHRPDDLHAVDAISTRSFEKYATATLHMPMISSLDQLDGLTQSTETIFKSYLKKTFEADDGGVENPRLNDNSLDAGDLSQTELAPEASASFVLIKKTVKMPAKFLGDGDIKSAPGTKNTKGST